MEEIHVVNDRAPDYVDNIEFRPSCPAPPSIPSLQAARFLPFRLHCHCPHRFHVPPTQCPKTIESDRSGGKDLGGGKGEAKLRLAERLLEMVVERVLEMVVEGLPKMVVEGLPKMVVEGLPEALHPWGRA